MKWIRRLAALLMLLALGVLAVGLYARTQDGPLGPFPGGPLRSGPLVEEREVDFTFAADTDEVALESHGRSRTTWILVVDGQAYVPCSLRFPPGKRWHHEALEDPEALVRIDGRRFRRRLLREDDPARRQRLFQIGVAKYGYAPTTPIDEMWFFRLAPPAG